MWDSKWCRMTLKKWKGIAGKSKSFFFHCLASTVTWILLGTSSLTSLLPSHSKFADVSIVLAQSILFLLYFFLCWSYKAWNQRSGSDKEKHSKFEISSIFLQSQDGKKDVSKMKNSFNAWKSKKPVQNFPVQNKERRASSEFWPPQFFPVPEVRSSCVHSVFITIL